MRTKLKVIAIAALTSVLLSGSPQASAQFFESFEGGNFAGWAASGSNSIIPSSALSAAASHGIYSLEVTSAAIGYDLQLKRDNILPQLQQYSKMELDVYVPTLGPGFANAQLVINSEANGFQSSFDYPTGQFALSQGMNHLTWDYGADSVPMGGAWGIFQLVTVTDNTQPTNPLSPYYIDSFCLTNGEACGPPVYQSSFENSTDGWFAWDSASEPASVNAAGGAPAVAITDGSYALKIEANPTGAWTILTRLDHSAELLAAVKNHDTIEMDIFIEDGEILPETFSTLGFNLNHMKQNEGTPEEVGGFMTTYQSFTADDTGTSFHFKWKYAAEPSFNPDTSWAQFQMISVADDPAVGSDPITEFFIDNFRFTNSLVGDFDLDDNVDGGDFLTWQRDPSVGTLDEWKSNFGLNVGGGISVAASAVPEPTSAVLCLVGCALFVTRRRA